MLPWLGRAPVFPAPEGALSDPDGLLALGGDLSVARLLAAYRQGIFPWFSEGDPILWWSPSARMVLDPACVHVSRSLDKTLRNVPHVLRIDHDFRAVIDACAAPRPGAGGTWIVDAMRAAYCRLHDAGHAHSFEIWIDGELAGGLYGVSVGRAFFGESMFMRRRDASKMAFVHMARYLQEKGVTLVDCQMHTPHLERMGARLMPRATFLAHLAEAVLQAPASDIWCKETA